MPSEPSGLSSAKRPMLSPIIFRNEVTESPGNATAWAAPVRIGEGRFIRATLGSRQSLVGLKSRELINVSLRSLDSGSIRPRRGFVASGGGGGGNGGSAGQPGGGGPCYIKKVLCRVVCLVVSLFRLFVGWARWPPRR